MYILLECHEGPEPQQSAQCSQTVSPEHIHIPRLLSDGSGWVSWDPTYFGGRVAANYKARKPKEYAVPKFQHFDVLSVITFK